MSYSFFMSKVYGCTQMISSCPLRFTLINYVFYQWQFLMEFYLLTSEWSYELFDIWLVIWVCSSKNCCRRKTVYKPFTGLFKKYKMFGEPEEQSMNCKLVCHKAVLYTIDYKFMSSGLALLLKCTYIPVEKLRLKNWWPRQTCLWYS